jgi:hypothetical protein
MVSLALHYSQSYGGCIALGEEILGVGSGEWGIGRRGDGEIGSSDLLFITHATACNAVDRAISLSIEISGVVEIDSLGWGLITL